MTYLRFTYMFDIKQVNELSFNILSDLTAIEKMCMIF